MNHILREFFLSLKVSQFRSSQKVHEFLGYLYHEKSLLERMEFFAYASLRITFILFSLSLSPSALLRLNFTKGEDIFEEEILRLRLRMTLKNQNKIKKIRITEKRSRIINKNSSNVQNDKESLKIYRRRIKCLKI